MPVAVLILLTAALDPTRLLQRKFAASERLSYQVEGKLQTETRITNSPTWLPEDETLRYDFTLEIEKLLSDGVAQARYRRPSITYIKGETYDKPETTSVQKVGFDYRFQISSANELVGLKSLTKESLMGLGRTSRARHTQDDPIGEFINDAFRLGLFMGSVESSLDLAPKLPFERVKLGDTWKRTVSYQPQKLKTDEGKVVIQRLDYEYRYEGPQTVDGKPVERVVASLNLNTDLATFFNQSVEATPEQTGLQRLPLRLVGKIAFDLDPKTLRTLSASASSEGGFEIFLASSPNEPARQVRFKGQTLMTAKEFDPSKKEPKPKRLKRGA